MVPLRERLEARFALIAEVERSLVGVWRRRGFSPWCAASSPERAGTASFWVGTAEGDGNDPRGVQRGGRRGVSAGGHFPVGTTRPPGRHRPETSCGRAARSSRGRSANGLPDEWRDGCRRHGLVRCAAARIEQHGSRTGSRRARRHGHRLRRGRDGGACRDGPPRGKRDPGARRHEVFVAAKASYDELLRNQRDGVILVREGKVVRANPRPPRCSGTHPRGFCSTPTRFRSWRNRTRWSACATNCGSLAKESPGASGKPLSFAWTVRPSRGDPHHLGAQGGQERHVRPEAARPPRDGPSFAT